LINRSLFRKGKTGVEKQERRNTCEIPPISVAVLQR
jgi:hypothetical protein